MIIQAEEKGCSSLDLRRALERGVQGTGPCGRGSGGVLGEGLRDKYYRD